MDNYSDQIFFTIFTTTLIILLLVAAIIITLFLSARKQAKQEMQLAQAKLEFEKELRQVENEVSEHILGQMAQELHDNIGQELTALHLTVQNQKMDHPQQSDSFKTLEVHITHIDKQLRLLSRTLNYDYLGHIGLFAAIQTQVERVQSLNRFHVICHLPNGPSNLSKNQELMIFRILQEIIQNALRHSGATEFSIQVQNAGQQFSLTTQDNGKGFDPDQVKKGAGLAHIEKRANLAGLTFAFSSAPGKGCRYHFSKIEPI
ncbi:MAG: ATP-binding protein [Sediminibacterium sp.]|nr:ATP-binding protein [Sediminibacterium sp.]